MRNKKLGKFMKYTSLSLISLLSLLSLLTLGCQTTTKQNQKANSNTTLLLDPASGEVITKTLNPTRANVKNLESMLYQPQNNVPKDSDKGSDKGPDITPKDQVQKSVPNRPNRPNRSNNPNPMGQRLINVGTPGYSRLEVYTEIPVPTQYSPARVVGGNNGLIFIPATPQNIQRVKISQTSGINQLRGFIDYGTTVNIPVQTPRGTRYIQQRSPMPMPIIDSVRITHQ